MARQLDDPASTLNFFRTVLHLRRNTFHFTDNDVQWLQLRDDALAFFSGGVLCVLNTGTAPLALPDGELLAASVAVSDGALPPDSAAWLATG